MLKGKERLAGKKVFVTGGSSGIGRAICSVFALEGAQIFIADIDSNGGLETAKIINAQGRIADFCQTDVSNSQSVHNSVRMATDTMGGIDVLVNDAAAFVFGTVEQASSEDWAQVLGVNVLGTVHTVRESLPFLRESNNAAIVNIASVSSFIAQPAFVPYNTSKGALLQLTRCLAMDLAEDGIRVNCVCPGSIYTPATERHIAFEKANKKEFLKAAGEGSLLKRVGTPEEVAYAALFLASDEASFITGTQLVVDGGATA